MKKTYSTAVAARRIGVSFRTLNRWLELKKIRPSQGIPFGDGRTLWLWTDADIAKGRSGEAGGRQLVSESAIVLAFSISFSWIFSVDSAGGRTSQHYSLAPR